MVDRPTDQSSSTATHRPSERRAVSFGGTVVGAGSFALIAGPCAVENPDLLLRIATAVADAGAGALRGGAFKPRTSPFAFQGLGAEALDMLAAARRETGLPVVTELLDVRDAERVGATADVVQIGARSMQSAHLLREAALLGKPVLLKRNPGATIDEFLAAADYILSEGNDDVILCERGIRTFEQSTRYTLDVAAVPVLRQRTHLPVIVDPSHAAGRSDLVLPLARAAVAAGADGIMVEVHEQPEQALSDGAQSLTLAEFPQFVSSLRELAEACGLTWSLPSQQRSLAPSA